MGHQHIVVELEKKKGCCKANSAFCGLPCLFYSLNHSLCTRIQSWGSSSQWDTDGLCHHPSSPPNWTRAKQRAFAPASQGAKKLQPCILHISQMSQGDPHDKAGVRTCLKCSCSIFCFPAGVGICLGRAGEATSTSALAGEEKGSLESQSAPA